MEGTEHSERTVLESCCSFQGFRRGPHWLKVPANRCLTAETCGRRFDAWQVDDRVDSEVRTVSRRWLLHTQSPRPC
jgi:hypothetical protein